VDKVNGKIGRMGQESVILKADDYRKKKEIADAFEMIQTDDEKFGYRVWYL